MNTTHICPSCHSETKRLTYCIISRQMVCAESCALTDADMFLLELWPATSPNRSSFEMKPQHEEASGVINR